MFLTRIFIERPRMLLMIVLALAIFGALSYMNLPLTLMPEVDLPYVTIQTIYPGAGPKEIETLISRPIEDAISTISGIDAMSTISLDNVSFIILEFDDKVDKNVAKQDVKDKVDAIIAQLPDDAEAPVISTFDVGSDAIFEMSLVGTHSTRDLYEFADKMMKDRLSQIKGVAQINLTGGQKREFHVKFNRSTLQNYGLSLIQVVGFIGAQNINMPGGYIQKSGNEYTVRLDGEFKSVYELQDLKIQTPFGPKRLGDIADVEDTQEKVREKASYWASDLKTNGRTNTINISVQKTSDANEVETAELAKAEVDKIIADLPAGMAIYISQDYSTFTKGARNDTVSNILIGIFLTALILLFFLHDIRSTIIVSLSMPVAIITTFIFMSVSGFSMNMLTLMAISVSVGILVTNSIVVIENIYRHAQMGESMKHASLSGATEIAIAVAATTLTNVVVFLPVANMSGIIGGVFKQFGLTITYATIISLMTSFTLTPMLSAYLLKIEKVRKLADMENLSGIQVVIEKFLKYLEALYHRTLDLIVGHKGREALLIGVTFIVLIFSLMLFPLIGGEFMPNVDQGDVKILVDMPTNYDLSRTQTVTDKIETRLKKYSYINSISTTVGTQGGLDQGQNLAQINVKLVPNDQRDITSRQFTTKLRRELADIPDASLKISAVSRVGGGTGDAIELQVMGLDFDRVVAYAEEIAEKAKQVPGAINVSSDYKPGKPELRIVPDRLKLADMGVTASQLAMEIRAALEGIVSSRYREGGYEYDIYVKLADEDKSSPEMIGQLPIATPRGFVPLEQIAHVDYTTASTKLTRIDKFSTVSVSMGSEGRTTSEVLSDVMTEVEAMNLPGGYKVQVGGQAKMMQESFASMFQALLLALILTYMLLVSILESFLQPFIIFFTIPLSLIGIMLSLFLTGNSLNMISIMSIIMLVGIVVNNAILLIDYINTLRSKGEKRRDAIVDACPVKLKPILMSTIAIALGMLPLALGIGSDGVEMRQGMGIVTIGGLLSSSIFTMYVIPVLYRWLSHKDEQPA